MSQTDDPYAAFYAAFLTEHPDALAGVKMRTLPGGTEPQMMMTTATMTRFILWALDKGYVTRPELTPEVLGLLSRISAEHPRRGPHAH
jgi:hypothetical protein